MGCLDAWPWRNKHGVIERNLLAIAVMSIKPMILGGWAILGIATGFVVIRHDSARGPAQPTPHSRASASRTDPTRMATSNVLHDPQSSGNRVVDDYPQELDRLLKSDDDMALQT